MEQTRYATVYCVSQSYFINILTIQLTAMYIQEYIVCIIDIYIAFPCCQCVQLPKNALAKQSFKYCNVIGRSDINLILFADGQEILICCRENCHYCKLSLLLINVHQQSITRLMNSTSDILSATHASFVCKRDVYK
jgi:hypothetical protein